MFESKSAGRSGLWIAIALACSLPAAAAFAKDTSSVSSADAAARLQGLLRPQDATAAAPEQFRVRFSTTEGDFVVEVTRAWAPNGADRFYHLVRLGFYDEGIAFYRVVEGFMAQFGIHPDRDVSRAWRLSRIKDDPVVESNRRGYVSFAQQEVPDTRSCQIFINLGNNRRLDRDGFAPFGKVVEGMDTLDAIFVVGEGPNQRDINRVGYGYLRAKFPEISYIQRASLLEWKGDDSATGSAPASASAGAAGAAAPK